MKTTVIIPVYNEITTIKTIVEKILNLKDLDIQIIIVDDFSTDGTRKIIENELNNKIDKLILHSENLGKGAAINSAKKFIEGDIVIIQDADLEYDPNDYYKLIQPIINKTHKVVYGSRVLNINRYKDNNFTSNIRVFANHMLTILSNLINNQKLTDAHTCYKAFDSRLFKDIELKEYGFSFCPEITTKISNLKIEILEIKISYKGRSFKEGKKITIKDEFHGIKTLFKYKF